MADLGDADACRLRKSGCMMRDGSSLCTMCELRESTCTFLVQSNRDSKSARRHDAGGGVGGHRGSSSSNSNGDSAHPAAAAGPISSVASSVGPVPEANSYLADALSPEPVVASDSHLRATSSFSVPSPGSAFVLAGSLGSEKSRFAELYGLTSNSEPIFIVTQPPPFKLSIRSGVSMEAVPGL